METVKSPKDALLALKAPYVPVAASTCAAESCPANVASVPVSSPVVVKYPLVNVPPTEAPVDVTVRTEPEVGPIVMTWESEL